MKFDALVVLPVALPLFAAGLALAFARYPRIQRIVTLTTLIAVGITGVVLLILADSGPLVVNVGGWSAPVGIALVADRLSSLLVMVSAFVAASVLLYSLAQGLADGDSDAPVSIFHPTFLVLTAGVANAFLSGDLFNIYVGFEILLFASYVLITMGGSSERVRAGTIYIIVAAVSSVVFLAALAIIYAATGTVNMAQLATRLDGIDPAVATLIHAMLLLAFGVKAAIFPLSVWLPDSYPTAPAPVTAVFAGLLTKVGVYAIIRTETLLFPGGDFDKILLVLAAATMIFGILGAVAQQDLKRLLSFTLVSHIGFMVFGIALSTRLGIAAAIFYVVHHIIVQTSLFLVAGLVERHAGTTSLRRPGGLYKSHPSLALLFLVAAFNLAGIPPLSGFLGKIGLLEAGAQVATPWVVTVMVASILTSLLTLYALVKVWNTAFWKPRIDPLPQVRTSRSILMPAALLVIAGLAITVLSGPLYNYTYRAARDLTERTPYISAVLPDGGRGDGESQYEPEAEGDDSSGISPSPTPSPTMPPEPSPTASPEGTSQPDFAPSTSPDLTASTNEEGPS